MKIGYLYLFAGIMLLGMLFWFFVGRRCNTYLSNNEGMNINTNIFDIECRVCPDEMTNEPDLLNVNVFYKEKPYKKTRNIRIYPINRQNNDTLKHTSEIESSSTSFKLPKNWNNEINLVIKYDIDSLGSVFHKKISFARLKKMTICRTNFALH